MVNAKQEVPDKCLTCGNSLIVGGPIWSDKIHNVEFVQRLLKSVSSVDCKLKTAPRIKGILGGVIDEQQLEDRPLSYHFNQVSSNLKCINPTKLEVIAAFLSLNYKIGQTYYDPDLWKTDAPPEAVYDIFK